MKISRENLEKLIQISNNESISRRVKARLEIILLKYENLSNSAIAKRISVSRPTIIKWLDTYQKYGLEALLYKGQRAPLGHKQTVKQALQSHSEKHTNKITQKQISKALGLSTATVSLALTRDPKIAPETQKRVIDYARLNGYKLEYSGRALSALRWNQKPRQLNIAYVNISRKYASHPNHKILRGIKRASEQIEYNLSEFYLDEQGNVERLKKVLYAQGISGLILGFMHKEFEGFVSSLIEYANEMKLPIATCIWYHEKVLRISPEIPNLIEYCLQKVKESGYQKIGMISKPKPSIALSSFVDFYSFLDFPSDTYIPPFEDDNADSELIKWVDVNQPQVIIGRDHHYRRLIELGIQIPKQVNFLSMEKKDDGSQIAGYSLNFEQYGEMCIWQIDLKIRHMDYYFPNFDTHISLGPTWCPGNSFIPQSKNSI